MEAKTSGWHSQIYEQCDTWIHTWIYAIPESPNHNKPTLFYEMTYEMAEEGIGNHLKLRWLSLLTHICATQPWGFLNLLVCLFIMLHVYQKLSKWKKTHFLSVYGFMKHHPQNICWNVFEFHIVYRHWDAACSWNCSSSKTMICQSYLADTISSHVFNSNGLTQLFSLGLYRRVKCHPRHDIPQTHPLYREFSLHGMYQTICCASVSWTLSAKWQRFPHRPQLGNLP